jgi:arylformamidase
MKDQSWFDISIPLDSRLVIWPGDPPLKTWLAGQIDPLSGSTSNITAASLSLHSGTHIDAPCHYIQGGKGVEEIPLQACLGPARLLFHAPDRHITAKDLESMNLEGVERILLGTTNADRLRSSQFSDDYVALLPDAASWLAERGFRLVGIDYLSIGPPGPPGDEVHRILLEAGVVILEGIVPEGLEPGDYELAALPLLVPGSDGAPARAAVRPLGSLGL